MSEDLNKKMISAGAIGNILEWYDFAVYGYFATSIGRAFFPKEDPIAQLLFAFGVFAIGYLMRPLGAIVIGNIGDRVGRKQALSNSFSTTTNAYSSGAVAYSGSYTARTTGAAMLGGFSGSFSSDYCGATAQAGVGGIGFSFGAGGPVIDNGCLMLRSFERIQQAASALGPSDPEGAALLRSASLEVLAEVDPRIRNIFVNKGLIVSPEVKALASNGSSLVGADPQLGKDLTVKQIRPINQPAISSISKTEADENETSKKKSSAAFAK